MAKEFEILDTMIQSQKEFMETWMNTQKELWERMTESTRKMQEALLSPLCQAAQAPGQAAEQAPGQMGQQAQREFFNIYNTMMETMINTSKVYTDEAVRMQDAWMHTINKQMEIGRRLNTNLFELGKAAGEAAGRMAEQGREEAAA